MQPQSLASIEPWKIQGLEVTLRMTKEVAPMSLMEQMVVYENTST
jgi:hypothetical protein